MKKNEKFPKKALLCHKCGVDISSAKKYEVEISGGYYGAVPVFVCAECYSKNEKKIESAMRKRCFAVMSPTKGLTGEQIMKMRRMRLAENKQKREKLAKKKEQARLDRLDETKMPVI